MALDPAIKQLSDAVLSAVGNPAALGNISSGSAAVDQAYSAEQNAGFFNQASQGIGAGSAQQADNERENTRRALEKEQNKRDPNKYQVKRKEDGGFAFFDPDGNQIGIDQYTKNTGVKAVDVLRDSENPVDLQYVDEYDNLRTLIKAINDDDTVTVSSFRSQNPSLGETTPDGLMRAFVSRYPHIYGNGSYDDTRKNYGTTLFKDFNKSFGTSEVSDFDAEFGL